ncbi:MAG: outer membrane protein assembly factor BamB [Cardiobacteriaceae bacterium]|nr:outer membrane protein assembly factor BamB [Cardiobacteriaceae bacterium]
MKKRFSWAYALFLLTACSGNFFYGKSNFPEPRELDKGVEQSAIRTLWQHSLGEEQSALALQPVYGDGEIFAISADGHLRSYDAETGAMRLNRALGNNITAGLSFSQGVILLGTENGTLLALDAQTGLPRWQALLSSQALAKPAVGDGLVVVRTLDGRISAYNVQTGEHLWHYHLPSPALSMRGQASVIVEGGVVLVVTDDARLLILDQDNGVALVEERMAVGEGHHRAERMVDIDAQPQLLGDYLFASAYQKFLMAFDVRRGQWLWKQDLSSALRDFAIVGQEILVFGNDRGHLYGLSLRDGRPLWHVTELEGRKLSPVVALGRSQVAVLDFEGYVHQFDAHSGSALGRKKVADTGADSSPLILGQRLIWQLNNGRLIALEP